MGDMKKDMNRPKQQNVCVSRGREARLACITDSLVVPVLNPGCRLGSRRPKEPIGRLQLSNCGKIR